MRILVRFKKSSHMGRAYPAGRSGRLVSYRYRNLCNRPCAAAQKSVRRSATPDGGSVLIHINQSAKHGDLVMLRSDPVEQYIMGLVDTIDDEMLIDAPRAEMHDIS